MQEAEAFALYHKALDLQKHDKLEESARAYHELLKTPLLKEVTCTNCVVKRVTTSGVTILVYETLICYC